MDLKRRLQRQRIDRREKKPFRRSAFARVSALVQVHGLDEAFIVRLERFRPEPGACSGTAEPASAAPRRRDPLFGLVGEDSYRTVAAILERRKNPYLPFAETPEDILWSDALYRRHPRISPESLEGRSFKALYCCTSAAHATTTPEHTGRKEPSPPHRSRNERHDHA